MPGHLELQQFVSPPGLGPVFKSDPVVYTTGKGCFGLRPWNRWFTPAYTSK
jgi:hypothetical protein